MSIRPGAGDKGYSVRDASWSADRERLRRVREPVFIDEQKVPPDMEWDEDDLEAFHALAVDDSGRPVGTGRLTRDGRIGRMAVLKDWRDRGVGRAILVHLMERAREAGMPEVVLNAQLTAIGFYRRFGYIEEGEEFMDAGIPHRRMRLSLRNE